jgi:hypothetical protein
MKTLAVGPLAAIAGIAVALVGVGVYQAWWTVVFVIAGGLVAVLHRQGLRLIHTIAIGAAVAISLALGGLGAFLTIMSGSTCARPDLPCPSGPPPVLLVGLGTLAVSFVGLVVTLAYVRRRLRDRASASRRPDASDIARR